MNATEFAAAVTSGKMSQADAVDWVKAHVWPVRPPRNLPVMDPRRWDQDEGYPPEGAWPPGYFPPGPMRDALEAAYHDPATATVSVPWDQTPAQDAAVITAAQTAPGHE